MLRGNTVEMRSEDRYGIYSSFATDLRVENNAGFAADAYGRITYWNRAAEENFGWTAQEAVGERKPAAGRAAGVKSEWVRATPARWTRRSPR